MKGMKKMIWEGYADHRGVFNWAYEGETPSEELAMSGIVWKKKWHDDMVKIKITVEVVK